MWSLCTASEEEPLPPGGGKACRTFSRGTSLATWIILTVGPPPGCPRTSPKRVYCLWSMLHLPQAGRSARLVLQLCVGHMHGMSSGLVLQVHFNHHKRKVCLRILQQNSLLLCHGQQPHELCFHKHRRHVFNATLQASHGHACKPASCGGYAD